MRLKKETRTKHVCRVIRAPRIGRRFHRFTFEISSHQRLFSGWRGRITLPEHDESAPMSLLAWRTLGEDHWRRGLDRVAPIDERPYLDEMLGRVKRAGKGAVWGASRNGKLMKRHGGYAVQKTVRGSSMVDENPQRCMSFRFVEWPVWKEGSKRSFVSRLPSRKVVSQTDSS